MSFTERQTWGPEQLRILRLAEVRSATGLSRSTLYQLMAKGQFLHQVPLGGRSVGWIQHEISAWIQQRIALRTIQANDLQECTEQTESGGRQR